MGSRTIRRSVAGVGLSVLTTGLAVPAIAQEAPGVPQAIPSREEVTPPTPQGQAPSTVNVDARGAIERQPCPFDDSPLRLNLTRVIFARPDGSALQPEIAQTLARVTLPSGDQPLRTVCEIRDAANAALRRDGWVASVQVPPQEITTGELRLNVVTAKIVETRVRGSAGPYEALLRERIAKLESLDPLNERDAEQLLLLAGDVPGLDVQLSLRPAGTGQGQVIGELAIS